MDLIIYISTGTCICLPQPSLQKRCGTFQLQNSQLYHLTFIWGICSQHLVIMMSNWIPKQHCDFFLNMPALHLRESWLNKESLKKGGNNLTQNSESDSQLPFFSLPEIQSSPVSRMLQLMEEIPQHFETIFGPEIECPFSPGLMGFSNV